MYAARKLDRFSVYTAFIQCTVYVCVRAYVCVLFTVSVMGVCQDFLLARNWKRSSEVSTEINTLAPRAPVRNNFVCMCSHVHQYVCVCVYNSL